MRTLLTSLLMAALVFGAAASQAGGQDMVGPAVARNRRAVGLQNQALRANGLAWRGGYYAPGWGYNRRGWGYYWPGSWQYGRAAMLYGAGAYMEGQGSLLRDSGERDYLRSLARINDEYARQLRIENRQQAVEQYFALKKLNREARQELAQPKVTAQELTRFAKERLPDVLTGQQLDRESGRVYWPMVLLRDEFADDRGMVDALFAQRANSQSVAADINSEIAALTEGMLQTLRETGSNLNSTDFITAMKFIKSLNYEARMSPTESVLPGEYLAGGPTVNSWQRVDAMNSWRSLN